MSAERSDKPAIPAYRREPCVLVLAGPSGSGKSTLIKRMLAANDDLVMSISATTRAPRGQEQDGIDYFFLDEADFRRRIDAGAFLEHAQVFGKHFYGTPRAFIDEQFAAGRSVIMDIDVQGAAQVRAALAETPERSLQVFVTPPSWQELERRLRHRGTDAEAVIQRRMAEAERELARWREFDHVVINDDLDAAVHRLQACLTVQRMHNLSEGG